MRHYLAVKAHTLQLGMIISTNFVMSRAGRQTANLSDNKDAKQRSGVSVSIFMRQSFRRVAVSVDDLLIPQGVQSFWSISHLLRLAMLR
jgi:hypothetical protein